MVTLVLTVPELATKLPATTSVPVTISVVVLIYVNVPVTLKLPARFTSPVIPTPPLTTNAPVVAFVLGVLLAATKLPLLVCTPEFVNVVNAPVLAVVAPIGVLFKLPPVITALAVLKPVVAINVPILPLVAFKLAELKFVTTPLVEPSVANPLTDPPVICALPVLKFVTTAVLKLPVPVKLVALNTPVLGLNVKLELTEFIVFPVVLILENIG